MIKHYCDKCGKEIEGLIPDDGRNGYWVQIDDHRRVFLHFKSSSELHPLICKPCVVAALTVAE